MGLYRIILKTILKANNYFLKVRYLWKKINGKMIKLIKSAFRTIIIRPSKKIKSRLNKMGNKRECYVCRNTFNNFTKYRKKPKHHHNFMTNLDMVGSVNDIFGCPYCGAHDRERHLFMFFDEIKLWEKIPKYHILHFAPERNLCKKIGSLNPNKYIRADIAPQKSDVVKVDSTNIFYKDNTFDLVILNHVLEHIPDYLKAIKEVYRVLKPMGVGILQTPYSKLLSRNFEEENICTDTQRIYFYGEKDHYRIFSEKHFFKDLKDIGFVLKILKSTDFFDDKTSFYYGINKKEDLIQVIKPNN